MQAIDTGAACNNRCAICPRLSGGLTDEGALEREAAAGVGELTLHGGEPTLIGGLDRVIAAAVGAGRGVTIESNGRAFAVAGRAEAAKGAGLGMARLALLGAREGSHDWLARVPGSFRQTVAGAARLKAAKVRLAVRLVVTRSSLPELSAMATLALGMGAEEVRFSWARMEGGPEREWLVPRYRLGIEEVGPAGAAVARAGRAVAVDGVPLCLAPAGLPAVATGAVCFAPVTDEEDLFAPKCEGCAKREQCPGVPRGYLARFGDEELAPFA